MKKDPKRIPMDDLKPGWLYEISARNASIGVWYPSVVEYHWDTGAPFGTVSPKRELEKAPDFFDGDTYIRDDPETECKRLDYLNEVMKSDRFGIARKELIEEDVDLDE